MKFIRRLTGMCTALLMAAQAAPFMPSQAEAAGAAVCAEYADEYGEVISGLEYTIMVRLSGKYITAADNGNVHQWEKLGNDSQVGRITSAGKNLCRISPAGDPSLALTVEGGDSTNGNNIMLCY